MDQGTLNSALRDALGQAGRKDSGKDRKPVIVNIQGDLNINISNNSFYPSNLDSGQTDPSRDPG